MTSKTLSTSTLSLRFMQNAHRAKQLKEVELDRAEVKDDEKWEVSQAVRDSWGVSAKVQSGPTEVHEASYLPFLFSESAHLVNESGEKDIPIIKKATGRRAFNKTGEVVSATSTHSAISSSTVPAAESSASSSSAGRKIHPRPVTISASGSSGHLRGFDQLTKPKDGKTSKSAREAIFENSGVGTDLRSESRTKLSSASTTFMKPVGVDDPRSVQTTSKPNTTHNSEAIIDGARQKKKPKRARDAATHESNEGSQRPKKAKKTPE
ncbi:hypothetical protein HYPSUDRAFT_65225 [Hypholoma sublateritium FD-334 SS-4]|uniref:Uncharacterized protein n=1 Tax=Hypholoma sublateritium (strain FD-334 SS-4) TaxID=945553 RepID=A0A0D2LCC4_HYPSF|nr:hypothetical protein HYPSUDRAFT_65225 [Hypholoma sublateritium FD-334 SS-4]